MPGRRARAVVGVLVAGILAACSGGAGEGGEDEDEGEVAPSGVLRLAVAGEIGLDPAGANPADPAALIVADLLYDGLTAVDDRGEVVPALAESWTTEAGSTAWTFRLSSAARTAGGEPVDAAMVVRSLSHAASGGDASLVAARLEPVVGYRDVVEGRSDTLAGVTAVDAGTVRIALTGPMATLPWLLSSPLLGVRDPQAAADDLAAVTGRFVARRERGVLRLEPREGVGAAVEGIELRSFGSVEAAFRALVEGDADWALRPADEADEALPEGLVDRSAPFQAVVFLGANASVPSLASGELRRAVALSLDREALVEAAFPGAAEPLATLVPAGGIGHRATACGDLCRSDRAAARTLVAAAFPAGGPPVLHLDVDDTPAQRRLADEVAHQLGDVGLTVEVRARPSADYEAALAAGEVELFSAGWVGVHPGPDAYLVPLLLGTSADNLTGADDPGVDAAVAEGLVEGPSAGAWSTAESTALSAGWIVPVAQFRVRAVTSARVEGLAHRLDGTFDATQVRLG